MAGAPPGQRRDNIGTRRGTQGIDAGRRPGRTWQPEPRTARATEGATVTTTIDLASTTPNRVPTYRTLATIVFVVCVVGMLVSLGADLLINGRGEAAPRDTVDQLSGVATFGTIGLLVTVLPAIRIARSERAARIGALAYGILAVPLLFFFWCGVPGMFGAASAYLAGLTRGRTPSAGPVRAVGVIGLVFAVLNPVVVLGLSLTWWIFDLS